MRVAFLGNHTVGVRVLETLHRESNLVGVIAHPEDPEDGVRYESVFEAGRRLGVPTYRINGKSEELSQRLRELAPDLIWVTDYRYLLASAHLSSGPLGAVNLHPSLLPQYRGRASINWAIMRGEKELGLTAHFIDSGMDTGDIIARRSYTLMQNQDVGDALNMLYPLYQSLTSEVIGYFKSGDVPREPQSNDRASSFPRRKPEDGVISWQLPSEQIWNLVRAVAVPYPGAFTRIGSTIVRIWKISRLQKHAPGTVPLCGEITDISPDRQSVTIACADAAVVVTRYTLESAAPTLQVGMVLA